MEENPTSFDNQELDSQNDDLDIKLTPSNHHQHDQNIEKANLNFRSYGLITVWLLPVLIAILFAAQLALFIIVGAFVSYFVEKSFIQRGHVSRFGKGLAFFPYHIARLTFGMNLDKKNPAQLRYWWFLLIGWFFGFAIGGLVIVSFYVIIPPILIIYKRREFLSLLFILCFLPRGEYFSNDTLWVKNEKDIVKRKKDKESLKQEYGYTDNEQYFHFYPPNRTAKLSAYFTILAIPIGLITILTVVINARVDQNSTLNEDLLQLTGIAVFFALVGLVPYLILMSLRKKRITRIVTTKMAEAFVQTISHSTMSSIPIFSGDYFLEENSTEMNMHHNFGFFEIFKRGRVITILLLPISIIASVFGSLISQAEDKRIEAGGSANELTVTQFVETFYSQLNNPQFVFYLIVLIPVALSIILPLIWVLNDAEIKRATWKIDETDGLKREISSVEDLGGMINRYMGLVVSFSAITNLIQLIFEIVDTTGQGSLSQAIGIFGVIMIIGGVIVLPGAFFMSFRYFATGDHAAGVNYLRYNLSLDPDIAVGTINKTYSEAKSLPIPISPTIKAHIEN